MAKATGALSRRLTRAGAKAKPMLHRLLPTGRELLVTLLLLCAATGLCQLFYKLHFTEANIITVYILDVLLVSLFTKNLSCCVISSLATVLLFNFLYTEPRLTFHAYEAGYPATLAITLISSLITGTLAIENSHNASERERASALARTEQLRSSLLRSISHDLRTPLTSISGNADNLLSNYDNLDDESRRQIFTDIYDDALWLIGLVENLLSVTRIEGESMQLHIHPELVAEVIDEAMAHLDRRADLHQIRVELQDDLLLAKMDTRLIMQVLINLLNNAIAYTPEGSHITVSARKDGGQICIQVEDDGPGIADELKEKVFEMFFTGDNRVADNRRSLGLGLPLCKAVVSAHGGEIRLTDRSPHGCCFRFTLPSAEVELHE